jgi:hypothetical protein
MTRSFAPLLLIVFYCCPCFGQQGVDTRIPNHHLRFLLPNDKWAASDGTDSAQGVYFFKRQPVVDSHGRSIIPAIMLFIEDARKYNNDIVVFSVNKRAPFTEKGVKIDQTLFPSDKGYPLIGQTAVFMKTSYTMDSLPHILYMIHMIDRHKQAIQLYLDMTADLGDAYEQELLSTIRSFRED